MSYFRFSLALEVTGFYVYGIGGNIGYQHRYFVKNVRIEKLVPGLTTIVSTTKVRPKQAKALPA